MITRSSRRDGTIEGFVGGVCAESSVRLHSLRAMETGEPLLLRLLPDDAPGLDGEDRDASDGAVVEHNPCLSGGALEIFLEPHLPPSQLVVDRRLADRDRAWTGWPGPPAMTASAPLRVNWNCLSGPRPWWSRPMATARKSCWRRRCKRASHTWRWWPASARGVPRSSPSSTIADELRAQLHTPAGLNIGARTPAEIAISILAELVAEQHSHPGVIGAPASGAAFGTEATAASSGPATTTTDPVCGMTVAVSSASQQLQLADGDTVYFCGPGCRERYAREHAKARG